MDGEKVLVLQRWGAGLASSGRDEEVRAAGRAILLLADEIERLNRDLWHARINISDRPVEVSGLVGETHVKDEPVCEQERVRVFTPAETLSGQLVARLAPSP